MKTHEEGKIILCSIFSNGNTCWITYLVEENMTGKELYNEIERLRIEKNINAVITHLSVI